MVRKRKKVSLILKLRIINENEEHLEAVINYMGNDSIYPDEGLFGTTTNENITKAIEALKFLNDWYI